ncbi:hypothetical protein GRX03_07185 [Halovenus sp. WSH3]|uniref:Uncharacterized protein n=1 Tax=Halovenus carboxidivorans TaxID=2692199 RepID=A0A6B0T0L5_9EURY|nr:hypothetical protein [Halovenus carboxidivorans]MXR51385.1 hypothetical protein [Halovenus carboxidivorans]
MIDRNRREVLLAAGTLTVSALAGCSSGPDDDSSSGSSGSAEWLGWIPQSAVAGETDIIHLDVPSAVAEFPDEAQSNLGIDSLSEQYNVEPSEIQDFITVTDTAENGAQVVIMVAPLNPQELLDTFSVPAEETEQYNGYQVATQGRGSNVALGESALIIAPSPKSFIDADNGNVSTVDDGSGDLKTTIDRVSSATLSGAVSGDEAVTSAELAAEPLRGGVGISSADGGNALMEVHILFESASDAETVLDENEDDLIGSIEEDDSTTLVDLSQDGRYVVGKAETENYNL